MQEPLYTDEELVALTERELTTLVYRLKSDEAVLMLSCGRETSLDYVRKHVGLPAMTAVHALERKSKDETIRLVPMLHEVPSEAVTKLLPQAN